MQKLSWLTLLILIASLSCKSTTNSVERHTMILAPLTDAHHYAGLHAGFGKAFEFLKQQNLADLKPGKYEIDGTNVFCTITNDQGKSREQARLEAHRKYIDIQYVIAGDEEMGWCPTKKCASIATAYDPQKDIIFFNDPPRTWRKVAPGSFVIFYPEDSHAPMVGPGKIHKAVCKILAEP